MHTVISRGVFCGMQ